MDISYKLCLKCSLEELKSGPGGENELATIHDSCYEINAGRILILAQTKSRKYPVLSHWSLFEILEILD